jgi:hypothetical protein
MMGGMNGGIMGTMTGTYGNLINHNNYMNGTINSNFDAKNKNLYENQFSLTQEPNDIKWGNMNMTTKSRNTRMNNYY